MDNFLPIFVLLFISTALAVLIIFISILFGPRKRAHNATKVAPYESGMNAIGPGQRRFPVRFYLIAVLFILFDIEVIFVVAWAVVVRKLGPPGLIGMLIFLAILEAAHLYAWKKGALEWD